MNFRKTSVAVAVIVTLVTVTTLLMLGLGVLIFNIAHDRSWGKLLKERTNITDQLAESLSLPLWYFDDKQIEKIMESALKNESAFGIVVQAAGKDGRTFVRMKDGQGNIIDADPGVSTTGPLVEERDIHFSGRPVGIVRVIMTSAPIEALMRNNRILIAAVFAPFELILALSLYLLLWRMVLKPLKEVEAYADAVSSGSAGDRKGQAVRFHGELNSLQSSIEKMVGQLGARYAELHEEMKRRQESETRFKSIYTQSPIAIELCNATGRLVDVNPSCLELFGIHDVHALKGYSLFDDPNLPSEARRLILAGEPSKFESEFDFDLVKRNKLYETARSGRIYLDCFVTPWNAGGTDQQGYLVHLRDITERKRAEEALRLSRAQLLASLDNTPNVAVQWYDEAGRILYWNPASEAMYGWTAVEALGKTLDALIHTPEEEAEFLRILAGIRATPKPFGPYEAHIHRRDGTEGWVLATTFGIPMSEGLTGFVCMDVDITERKRAEDELKQHRNHLEEMVKARTAELSAANEKLKELDRLKSMFIASMSHELRTPLNSIIGFTGMTLQGMSGELNDEQKDNLTRAYLSAKHLLNLISDVIDISKIEAGRIETFPEEFALREVIDEAVATVETQLKGKGLTLEVDVPARMHLTTDRKRLLQCLINLLSNAVKYTEQGGVAIASRGTDGHVLVSVSDTGIGVAEKDIPRLFKPFERMETHLRVRTGGTGLGLYLTRKLAADILRGDVSVTSREGRGSTFTIRIPRDIREAPQASIEQNGR